MSSIDASIYDAVVAFLGEQRVLLHEERAKHRVRFEYASATGSWTTYAVAFEEERQLAIYGVVPVPADPPQLPALAELVTRINFGLVVGNFELDYDGGEIRCKTSLDLEGAAVFSAGARREPGDIGAAGGEPPFAVLLRQLLRANLALMEHHLPAFVAAVIHSRPVSEALALLGQGEATPPPRGADPADPALAEAQTGFRDAANP